MVALRIVVICNPFLLPHTPGSSSSLAPFCFFLHLRTHLFLLPLPTPSLHHHKFFLSLSASMTAASPAPQGATLPTLAPSSAPLGASRQRHAPCSFACSPPTSAPLANLPFSPPLRVKPLHAH